MLHAVAALLVLLWAAAAIAWPAAADGWLQLLPVAAVLVAVVALLRGTRR